MTVPVSIVLSPPEQFPFRWPITLILKENRAFLWRQSNAPTSVVSYILHLGISSLFSTYYSWCAKKKEHLIFSPCAWPGTYGGSVGASYLMIRLDVKVQTDLSTWIITLAFMYFAHSRCTFGCIVPVCVDGSMWALQQFLLILLFQTSGSYQVTGALCLLSHSKANHIKIKETLQASLSKYEWE